MKKILNKTEQAAITALQNQIDDIMNGSDEVVEVTRTNGTDSFDGGDGWVRNEFNGHRSLTLKTFRKVS